MLLVRIMYVYQYIYQQQAWNRISGVARITIISGVQSDDKITILYLIMQTGQKLPYKITMLYHADRAETTIHD